jgi:two-component system, NtrC family, sensor histidine kinase HydH
MSPGCLNAPILVAGQIPHGQGRDNGFMPSDRANVLWSPHPAARPMQRKRPFNLLRWFSLGSLAVIAAIAIANAWLLSDFLTRHLLEREAHVTRDFVENLLLADGSFGYLATPNDPELARRFRGTIDHFTAMRDVLRNNVYSRDSVVLWSSDAELIGRKFERNEELEDALKGELVINSGRITDELRSKPEHMGLHPGSDFFIETYIPVRSPDGARVLGVVEIYKAPLELTAAIGEGRRQVWAAAIVGALLLYITLYWIVWRADRTIRRQHDRLLEAEALALVGELTSSLAHNIRNPLASIRSSAELALEMRGENCGEQARDIVSTVDRVEVWMRDLLHFTRPEPDEPAPVEAAQLLRKCFEEFAPEFERHKLAGSVSDEAHGARVNANATLLGHALHSIVANAIDATPAGGRIEGRVVAGGGRIVIRIRDTGSGISAVDVEHVFRPFFTTKAGGFGLGLAQARRAVERFGGEVKIESTSAAGTTIALELPRA